MKSILMLCSFLAFTLLISCDATKQANKTDDKDNAALVMQPNNGDKGAQSTISPDQKNLSLADYLRRVPGVSVTGGSGNVRIRIRGVQTVAQGNEPLFVVNRLPVGNDYNAVESLVDVNDIDKVTVLRDVASTSQYGVQGSNGVILIKTKSRN